MDDLATTIAVLLVERRGPDTSVLAGRVGDTNVFAVTDGLFANAFPVVDGPRNIADAYLPVAGVPDIETRVFGIGDTAWILAATDGLANDVIDSPGVREWLFQLLREPADPLRLLNALSYRRQGSHDDRTGVAIWRWDGGFTDGRTAGCQSDHVGQKRVSSTKNASTGLWFRFLRRLESSFGPG